MKDFVKSRFFAGVDMGCKQLAEYAFFVMISLFSHYTWCHEA